MSVLTLESGHDLANGDDVYLADLVGGDGLEENHVYRIFSLSGNTCKLSEIAGYPTEVNWTTAIVSGIISKWPTYTVVADGVMDPPTTPAQPTGVGLASEVVVSSDGTSIVRLTVTFTPSTEDKLRATYVQVTFKNDNHPTSPSPVWDDDSVVILAPPGQNFVTIDGVAGNTPYWVRTWSADVFGNVSGYTTAVTTTSVKDSEAPAVVGGLSTQPVVKGLFVNWNATSAKDLAFYELRYAPDDGSGLRPDRTQWVTVRAKTTTVYVGGLTADSNGDGVADKKYWCQVRAIDTSGNVGAWSGDVTGSAATDTFTTPVPHPFYTDDVVRFTTLTGGAGLTANADYYVIASGLTSTTFKVSTTLGGSAVDFTTDVTAPSSVTRYPLVSDYLTAPEAGWSAPVSGNPALTGSTDIGAASISTVHVSGLDASVIKTGDLRISTTDANMLDGIKVYNPSGVLVGLWNETGLHIYSGTDATDYVRVYEAGISVFSDGVEVAAMTPAGLNATALAFGAIPGGQNLVYNSGFELYAFGAAAAQKTWTVAADWSGTAVSETNITEGAGALTMTGVSY